MCVVTTCCGCCDVRKGCKIMAIFLIVCGILSAVSHGSHKDHFGAGTSFLGVIMGIFLLAACMKDNALCALLYLIIAGVMVGLAIIKVILLTIGITIEASSNNKMVQTNLGAFVGMTLAWAIAVALDVYFWIVAYSFYKQLKAGDAYAATSQQQPPMEASGKV